MTPEKLRQYLEMFPYGVGLFELAQLLEEERKEIWPHVQEINDYILGKHSPKGAELDGVDERGAT